MNDITTPAPPPIPSQALSCSGAAQTVPRDLSVYHALLGLSLEQPVSVSRTCLPYLRSYSQCVGATGSWVTCLSREILGLLWNIHPQMQCVFLIPQSHSPDFM